jgi:peptidoglycan/xylan/chitin deacetylase (PgdA/CDA1 family)
MQEPIKFDHGVFTVSIDFELIWGTLDLFGPERFREACQFERDVVIERLLDLFVEFNIPTTWCVLGHLLLERCSVKGGQKHPDIVRPSHSWTGGDWFEHDPCGSEDSAPVFYARSLIEKIRNCSVPQEIGCHSFSHVIFGDAGCSRETAESEIAACVRAARELGIEMRSFAFPRNEAGHLDVLKKYGLACYRGPEPDWYQGKNWPAGLKRLCHLWNVITAATPPVVLPDRGAAGVWNVPGSMIYFPMHGLRRYITVSRRVRRAIKGLEAAADRKRIFHLWFHPTNLADQPDVMFAGLRTIFDYAANLRERGELAIMPMGAVVPFDMQSATASIEAYVEGSIRY